MSEINNNDSGCNQKQRRSDRRYAKICTNNVTEKVDAYSEQVNVDFPTATYTIGVLNAGEEVEINGNQIYKRILIQKKNSDVQ